jgi:hypothetical protein
LWWLSHIEVKCMWEKRRFCAREDETLKQKRAGVPGARTICICSGRDIHSRDAKVALWSFSGGRRRSEITQTSDVAEARSTATTTTNLTHTARYGSTSLRPRSPRHPPNLRNTDPTTNRQNGQR